MGGITALLAALMAIQQNDLKRILAYSTLSQLGYMVMQLTELYLYGSQLTDVKGLEKLAKLKTLNLENNPDLTEAQIAELRKALPKCRIFSNPIK